MAYFYITELDDSDAAALQKKAAQERASELGAPIIAYFGDGGDTRFGFFELWNSTVKNKVDFIIMKSCDSLNQDATEAEKIIKDLQRHGARVVFTY